MAEWYCREGRKDGWIEGPISEKDIKSRYVNGELDADAEVLAEGTKDWIPLRRAEFFANLPECAHRADPGFDAQPFQERPSRSLLLMLVCGGFVGVTWLTTQRLVGDRILSRDRMLFALYLAALTGFWIVYFASRYASNRSPFQVLTLRRLLRVTTTNWNTSSALKKTELEKHFQEKARISITATAMLVAVSGVVLSQVNSTYLKFQSTLTEAPNSVDVYWSQAILALATMCGFLAIACFIVAVDSLDGMFNHFASRKVSHTLRFHFYMNAINPRYMGLVSLLSASILLIGFSSPLLGCVAIGMLTTIGFQHWFPTPDLLTSDPHRARYDARQRNTNVGFTVAFLIAFCALPIYYLVGPSAPAPDLAVSSGALIQGQAASESKR
jgi:hypothetical protein